MDLPVVSHRQTAAELARLDKRDCTACHESGVPTYFRVGRKPMFDGVDTSGLRDLDAPALTWDFIGRLRRLTRMKILLKGIVTREDAKLAVERGADGIIVSNHGGRAEESARGSIESLPEVIAAVGGRRPVLIDGGFRRGTTSSRRSRWEQTRSRLEGPTSGASPPSGRPASRRSSTSCAKSWLSPCGSRG